MTVTLSTCKDRCILWISLQNQNSTKWLSFRGLAHCFLQTILKLRSYFSRKSGFELTIKSATAKIIFSYNLYSICTQFYKSMIAICNPLIWNLKIIIVTPIYSNASWIYKPWVGLTYLTKIHVQKQLLKILGFLVVDKYLDCC